MREWLPNFRSCAGVGIKLRQEPNVYRYETETGYSHHRSEMWRCFPGILFRSFGAYDLFQCAGLKTLGSNGT